MDGENQSKAKIFISYSRRDLAFAERLDTALKARGFDTLIDRSDIYALEDWWKRIETLIAQADTIVFVLSPDAVGSSICQREVAYAASLNKRLAPIVYQRVADMLVPEALARLNFIFFDDEARFDESVGRLAEALETDISWVRKHTEIGLLALRWVAAGRPGPRGLLLRSPMLEEAERWIASRPEGAPAPTEETQAFIAESRKAATLRRNILSASLGAGLLIALILAGLAYWQRSIAVAQRDKALIAQSRFLADQSRQSAKSGDQVSAALLAMEALPDNASGNIRPLVPEAEDALYQSLATLREVAVLSGGRAKITRTTYSSDGRRLLTRHDDGTIRVWDTTTHRLLATLGPFGADLLGAVFTKSGDRIELVHKDGSIDALDAVTGARADASAYLRKLFHDFVTGSILDISGDGRFVVLNHPLAVAEFDRTTAATRNAVPLDVAGIDQRAEFHISGNGAIVVSTRGTIWNAKTGKVIARIDPGADQFLAGVSVSPDGSKVVWQHYATAYIYDAASGTRITVAHPESEKIKGHERGQSNIYHTAFSPDGSLLATASADKSVRIWDAHTGDLIEVLEGHRDTVRQVGFLGNDKHLMTLSDDGTVRLWAVVTDNEILPGSRFYEKIIGAFYRNGAVLLVVQEDDNSISVWDDTHYSRVVSLKGPMRHNSNPTISRAIMDPSGQRLLTSTGDLTARVWNLRTGAEISRVSVHTTASQIFDLGFSPDGKLAFAAADALYVWDVDTGRIVDVMATSEVGCASFSPDAKQILAASLGEEIWDIASGKLVRQLTKDQLWCARFSPDGTHIVSAPAYSEHARILDAKTGAVIAPLLGHTHFVTNVEYSPDGRLILTRSEDSTARLWDASTGRGLRVFTDVGGLFSAHFTPDGKQVLTESGGAAFSKLKGNETEPWRGRLWPVFADITAMLERAKAMLPRCLTRDQRLAAFLDAEPPAWCIDMEKWPYAAQAWKEWLKYKRAGANPPLPDSAK